MSLLLLGCHCFQALSADRVRIHIHYTHNYTHVYIYMYIHMHAHRHTSITTTSVFSSIYSILKHNFKPVCPVPIQHLKAFSSHPTFPYSPSSTVGNPTGNILSVFTNWHDQITQCNWSPNHASHPFCLPYQLQSPQHPHLRHQQALVPPFIP